MSVHLGDVPLSGSDQPREGTAEYYRFRAAEMLKKAEEAVSENTRLSLIQLAANWQQLANALEHPNW